MSKSQTTPLTTNYQLPTTKGLRVAIVCDWLSGTGGAERVVLELHKMFPEAPIYTSQYDSDPKIWYGDKWFSGADVRTTWLQKLPKSLRKFLPVLRAWTFSRLDLSEYDLVISSSGAEAKSIRTTPQKRLFGKWKMENGKSHGSTPKGSTTPATDYQLLATKAIHIAYIHAPTHYYWSRYEQYLKNPGFGLLDPLARLGLKLLADPMRRWDKRAAARPDYLIANSTYTAAQIKKYYGREADVIHPPVDIDRFKPAAVQPQPPTTNYQLPTTRSGFLAAGRQTPYKRIDLAVSACTELNLPLTVIGGGPEHKKLTKLAGPTVKFLTGVPDEDMPLYFQKSEAFIFPGVDDFGIVAVEALAAGTPVIAFAEGGALDYVTPQTGLLFSPQSLDALMDQLKQFRKKKFNPSGISEYAGNFSADKFHDRFKVFIDNAMEDRG